MTQLALFSSNPAPTVPSYLEDRDAAMRRVIEYAGKRFRDQARAFVLDYLGRHGESAGEEITDACKAAGIVPHDDRAFGPVYHGLAKAGLIVKAGVCERRKGHGTSGGNVWRLA